MGCSSLRVEKPLPILAPTVIHDNFFHPDKPSPVRITPETYLDCGKPGFVCLTNTAAKAAVQNKIEAGRFIQQEDALIDYYRCFGSVPNEGRPPRCSKSSVKK